MSRTSTAVWSFPPAMRTPGATPAMRRGLSTTMRWYVPGCTRITSSGCAATTACWICLYCAPLLTGPTVRTSARTKGGRAARTNTMSNERECHMEGTSKRTSLADPRGRARLRPRSRHGTHQCAQRVLERDPSERGAEQQEPEVPQQRVHVRVQGRVGLEDDQPDEHAEEGGCERGEEAEDAPANLGREMTCPHRQPDGSGEHGETELGLRAREHPAHAGRLLRGLAVERIAEVEAQHGGELGLDRARIDRRQLGGVVPGAAGPGVLDVLARRVERAGDGADLEGEQREREAQGERAGGGGDGGA